MFYTSKPERWFWPFKIKCIVVTHTIIRSIIIATTSLVPVELSGCGDARVVLKAGRQSSVLAACRIRQPAPIWLAEVAGRKLAPSLHLSHSNYNLFKSCYPTPCSDNDRSST